MKSSSTLRWSRASRRQIARPGATILGTVGSEEKAEEARRDGCDHPIRYRDEDFVERVREVTGGRGVDVVYDSVGRAFCVSGVDLGRLAVGPASPGMWTVARAATPLPPSGFRRDITGSSNGCRRPPPRL